MWAWHVKMATQNLLKFTQQRIVYSFLKLWRAFLDWKLNLSTAGKGCQSFDRRSDRVNILFRFCMYNEPNFPFPFLMAAMKKYIRWAYLVNQICGNLFTTAIPFRPETCKGRAGCFILRGTSGTSSILLALRIDWGSKATWRGFLLA